MPFNWKLSLPDPIPLPGGTTARTLGDAATYISSLPKSEHDAPEWRLAIAELMTAAQGQSPVMHARIAVLQALHRNDPPRPFTKAVRERSWMRPTRKVRT